eukprot:Skav225697  [mRNA]  locus=scaffold1817:152113:157637:+ [translate_table: standard]
MFTLVRQSGWWLADPAKLLADPLWQVFKNPFKEVMEEMTKPKVEKVVDPVATWFSNRKDPMEDHRNRHSTQVGKYLPDEMPTLPGQSKRSEALPNEEMEYANVAQKPGSLRFVEQH